MENRPQEHSDLAAAVLLARRKERALARKLLAAERDTLSLTRDAVDGAVDRLIADIATDTEYLDEDSRARKTRIRIVAAAPIITAAIAAALVKGRQDARVTGREDIDQMFGRSIVVPNDGTDAAHSFSAASTLTSSMVGGMLRTLGARTARNPLAAIRRVVPLIEPSFRRTAATETAQAFNLERAEALDVIADEVKFGTPGGPYRGNVKAEPRPMWVKTWSAILDTRVCPQCAAMHGTTISAFQTFGPGDPPLHPWCRCVFILSMTTDSADGFERRFLEAA